MFYIDNTPRTVPPTLSLPKFKLLGSIFSKGRVNITLIGITIIFFEQFNPINDYSAYFLETSLN